jgi:3-(3-hydroxy-phenyl)propionate hydroxylase
VACLIPACRDYILQLKFKPKPQLQQGCFEGSAAHARSELLPQPLVERPQQGLVLLDGLLGRDFAVVGWDSPDFREHALRLLPAGVPGRVVALVHADDDFIGPEPGDGIERVRDATGELGRWLDARAAVAVVLRPDRYWFRLVAPGALARPQASPACALWPSAATEAEHGAAVPATPA